MLKFKLLSLMFGGISYSRQGKAWHGTARHGLAGQGVAGQGVARQGEAWHGTARQGSYPLIFKREIIKK